jgi:uncharacterized coiled-coil protein SlyX
MSERIRELEVENYYQRVQIKELTTQMAIKKSVYETYFRRLEALLLHGNSSSSVPKEAHPEGSNTKFGSPRKVVFVNTIIVRLHHFDEYV